jgi:hypothetical protein
MGAIRPSAGRSAGTGASSSRSAGQQEVGEARLETQRILGRIPRAPAQAAHFPARLPRAYMHLGVRSHQRPPGPAVREKASKVREPDRFERALARNGRVALVFGRLYPILPSHLRWSTAGFRPPTACRLGCGAFQFAPYVPGRLCGVLRPLEIAAAVLTIAGVRQGDAGDYDCVVTAASCPLTGMFSAAASICPADYDCDGTVTSSDISAFVTALLAAVQGGC